jgi:hypothetical protein
MKDESASLLDIWFASHLYAGKIAGRESFENNELLLGLKLTAGSNVPFGVAYCCYVGKKGGSFYVTGSLCFFICSGRILRKGIVTF